MTLTEFVEKYRDALDRYIAGALGKAENPIKTDEERRKWILNDESLYSWAVFEKVEV